MKLIRPLPASLRTRFVLGVAAMLVPLALLGASAFVSLRHMAAAFEEALADPVQEMHAIMSLQAMVQRAAMPPNDYLIHGEATEQAKFSHQRADVDRTFEEAISLVTLWPEQKALLESAREEWRQARKIAESLFEVRAPVGNRAAAREMQRLDLHIDRSVEILARAHALTQGELDEATEQARAIERQTLVLIVSGISVLGVFIAVGSGLLLARFVLMPLRALETGANRLRAGDLAHRVSCGAGTELGQLADAFNAMAEKLEKSEAELKTLATHDGLTGLYNHRTLYAMLADEVGRANRFNHPLSLLMIDVDHFKQVNDTHGHQAGDAVLQGLSRLFQKQVRAIDRVCRFGGEEITVILPETDADSAANIAERLRMTVDREPFGIGNAGAVHVTVSIGVATYPGLAKSGEALVDAADSAMYAAKQAGRNRVMRYEMARATQENRQHESPTQR